METTKESISCRDEPPHIAGIAQEAMMEIFCSPPSSKPTQGWMSFAKEHLFGERRVHVFCGSGLRQERWVSESRSALHGLVPSQWTQNKSSFCSRAVNFKFSKGRLVGEVLVLGSWNFFSDLQCSPPAGGAWPIWISSGPLALILAEKAGFCPTLRSLGVPVGEPRDIWKRGWTRLPEKHPSPQDLCSSYSETPWGWRPRDLWIAKSSAPHPQQRTRSINTEITTNLRLETGKQILHAFKRNFHFIRRFPTWVL